MSVWQAAHGDNIRWTIMAWADGRDCAAHMLPIAWEHEPRASNLGDLMFLRPRDDLEQPSQYIDDVVPQPAHTSQIKARSIERAMGASHSATGWACKAADDAAHLVRLRSARRSVCRHRVGAVQDVFCNPSAKGLTHISMILSN